MRFRVGQFVAALFNTKNFEDDFGYIIALDGDQYRIRITPSLSLRRTEGLIRPAWLTHYGPLRRRSNEDAQ